MIQASLLKTMEKFRLNNLSPEQLSILSSKLMDELDDILLYFDVRLKKNMKKLYGGCPIHGGDGKTNPFNMFLIGDNYSGNWKCRSHNCHAIFKSSFLGFIRGLLSKKKYDWQKMGDQIASFQEVIAWSLNWLKIKSGDIKVDFNELEKKRFIQQNSMLRTVEKVTGIDRSVVRKHLTYPAQQFIDRGFAEELLDKYDIGLCNDPKREMYNRVVVPIYDKAGLFMIGCSGRSIHKQCPNCKLYHPANNSCPDAYTKYNFTKWKHSKDFKAEQTLFNFWKAAKYIKDYKTAIITESVGNVLRLEEAGIKIGVGTFGTQFTEHQNLLLNELGVLNLIIAPDIDEHGAGMTWATATKLKYNRIYNVYIIDKLPKSDIGEMSIKEVEETFKPILNKLKINI